MSTIEVNKITPVSGGTATTLGDSGDTFTVTSGATFNASSSNLANRPNAQALIINGDMAVAQRGTSTASVTTASYPACDRWNFAISSGGTWTVSQDTDVPSGEGFSTSAKYDCTTAEGSLGSAAYIQHRQSIEGQNLQLLKKGTANAETVTVSFWVKATKTGTNILELYDNTNNRQCSQAYTISSSDTWEKKVVNFPADTSGALANNSSGALNVQFYLGAGSNLSSGTLQTTWASYVNANRAVGQVNHADSTSNNFYITGVQMEVGTYTSSTLPAFQHESFSENLHRCCRYFFYTGGGASYQSHGTGVEASSTAAYCNIPLPNILRASPTITFETAIVVWDGNSESPVTSLGNVYYAARGSLVNVACNCSGGGIDDAAGIIVYSSNDSTSGFLIDSEL
jgi:hypothetical protein